REQQGEGECEGECEGEPSKLIYNGSCLAFETFSVILDQIGNEHIYPAVHVYLAFIWCMSLNDTMEHVNLVVQWNKIATFLNTIIYNNIDLGAIKCNEFPMIGERK